MKRLAVALLFLLPSIALASQISVPSAPGAGYGLTSLSTGQYVASSTSNLIAGTGITFTGGTPYVFGPSVTITASGSTFGTSSLSAAYPVTYTQNASLAQFGLAFGTTTANSWSQLQQLNGNASTTQLSASGSIFEAGNLLISGSNSFGSTLSNIGQLYRSVSLGLVIAGNGSTNDTTFTNALGQTFLQNPTGTTQASFPGSSAVFTNAPIFSSLTGILKGNGGSALTVAANGTDYTLITAKTCNAGDFVSAVTAAGVFTCTTPSGTTYTATYPVVVTGSVISLAFGTSTSNTWGGTQTFSSPLVDGTLTGLIGGNNGTTYAIATSSNFVTAIGPTGQTTTGAVIQSTTTTAYQGLTVALQIVGSAQSLQYNPTLSGTLLVGGGGTGFSSITDGQLVMGAGSGTALTKLATSTIGSILQIDNSTGRPSWVATSTLKIALSDTTGTLTVARGGTGQVSFTSGQLLYGNAAAALSSVATGTISNGTNITVTNGGTASVIGSNITIALSGTVGVTNGGIGQNTLTTSQLLYGNGTAGVSSVGTTTPSYGLGLSGTNIVTLTSAAGLPSFSLATSSLYTGTVGQLPYFTGTNALAGTSTINISTTGNVGIGSTTPSSLLSVGNAAAGFLVTLAGKIWGRDTTNGFEGIVSPTRSFVLGTATTTTWTATSTGPYTPNITMPFAGTIKQARCLASTTQAFLGTTVYVNATALTPAYFVSSSTVGVEKFTAGNTFNAGDIVTAYFGTTTTDANAKYTSCTFDIIQTS